MELQNIDNEKCKLKIKNERYQSLSEELLS